MSKCWNCGIELSDPELVCPLCRCIVETVPGEDYKEHRKTYPFLDAEHGIKKMQRALNIYIFAAMVAALILIGADYAIKGNPTWVIIVCAFMVYGFITLKVSIQMNTGYQLKMVLQTLLAIAILILIDFLCGFYRWSFDYILPGTFALMDVAIIVLMIVNKRNWQSHIPMQILIIGLSVIPVMLYHFHILTNPVVAVSALAFSILTFVGTLIIGGRRARQEVYRRFHV